MYVEYLPLCCMKKLLAIFLLMLICSQICLRIGVYVSWKLNQEYLAKYECVNRNNPKSCCQAKCQLKKQLSKVDTSEQQNDQGKKGPIKVNDQEPFIMEEIQIDFVKGYIAEKSCQYKSFRSNYSFQYLRNSFQPPDDAIPV